MRADVRPPSRERSIAIARMILGDDAPESDVVDVAEEARRAAATLPPLSAEQRDVLAVLLRP